MSNTSLLTNNEFKALEQRQLYGSVGVAEGKVSMELTLQS